MKIKLLHDSEVHLKQFAHQDFQKNLEFQRKYFLETLNIPEEYVDGFLFYIVDNERYARAMKDKNKTMATFILSELAVEYLKLKEIEESNKLKWKQRLHSKR